MRWQGYWHAYTSTSTAKLCKEISLPFCLFFSYSFIVRFSGKEKGSKEFRGVDLTFQVGLWPVRIQLQLTSTFPIGKTLTQGEDDDHKISRVIEAPSLGKTLRSGD